MWAVTAAVVLVHAWLVTYGTWRFLEPEVRGEAYDSLGVQLSRGEAWVDEGTIGWEGFRIAERTYAYFGPFPALLRALPNVLLPGAYGRWSRLSCLLASLLTLLAASALARDALEKAGVRGAGARAALRSAVVAGVGLGSPLLYLVSCGRIYHEAILWGLCGGLFTLLGALRTLESAPGRDAGPLLLLSCGFAVALLSRLTFGLPGAIALAVLVPRSLVRRARLAGAAQGRSRAVAGALLAALPAAAAAGYQLWYDHARFGSVWETLPLSASYVPVDELGGVFNPGRVRDTVSAYLGARGAVSPVPPFFELKRVRYVRKELFFDWREEVISLPLSAPWLVVGAIAGLLSLRRQPSRAWAVLLSAAFLAPAVPILTFYFVTQRYAAELVPGLLLLLLLALRVPGGPLARGAVAASLGALVLLSSVVTTASTLHWNLVYNGDVPVEYKERLGRLLGPDEPVLPGRGKRVPLTTLPLLSETAGFKPLGRDRTVEGDPIRFRGRVVRWGIGMHAEATATWPVPEGTEALEALVGLPDQVNRCDLGSVVFEALDDRGTVLYRSEVVRVRELPVPVRIPLRGTRTLTLAVRDAGDGIDCDHGSWGRAAFVLR
ncbi:MAG: hypothetical protein EDX89_21430 [Acidobacteria bacterium]|nr:MAG: hypothetical protein EDX89_21430 [Acidobacteriota bacterium]